MNSEEMSDMPPSVKLIVKTLQHEGPLTQKELGQSTLLPSRTVRYALSRLEEGNAVVSKPHMTDGRKKVYSLNIENDNISEGRTKKSHSKENTADSGHDAPQDDEIEDSKLLEKIMSDLDGIDM